MILRSGGGLLRLFLICAVCVFQGCFSRLVRPYSEREEKVTAFMISEDGKHLVVVGKSHHYVFSLSPTLKTILAWEGRSALRPAFGRFDVRPDQSVSGSYTLVADPSGLVPSAGEFLVRNGFSPPQRPGDAFYFREGLAGTRYSAAGVGVPDAMAFRRPYPIVLRKMDSPGVSAVKEAASPVAAAADGTMIFAGILVLFPVLHFTGGVLGICEDGSWCEQNMISEIGKRFVTRNSRKPHRKER